MDWLTELDGKLVALDSAPLIYYMECHPKYGRLVDPFFSAVQRGSIRIATSTLTLLVTRSKNPHADAVSHSIAP